MFDFRGSWLHSRTGEFLSLFSWWPHQIFSGCSCFCSDIGQRGTETAFCIVTCWSLLTRLSMISEKNLSAPSSVTFFCLLQGYSYLYFSPQKMAVIIHQTRPLRQAGSTLQKQESHRLIT